MALSLSRDTLARTGRGAAQFTGAAVLLQAFTEVTGISLGSATTQVALGALTVLLTLLHNTLEDRDLIPTFLYPAETDHDALGAEMATTASPDTETEALPDLDV